jgi:hypothetical protein
MPGKPALGTVPNRPRSPAVRASDFAAFNAVHATRSPKALPASKALPARMTAKARRSNPSSEAICRP